MTRLLGGVSVAALGALWLLLSNLPAHAQALQQVASPQIGVAYKDQSALTIKQAFVSVGTDLTDFSLIAAVTGRKLCVLAYLLSAGTTGVDFTFNSASTAISMVHVLDTNGLVSVPWNPGCWFQTTTGEALTATTVSRDGVDASHASKVQIVYVEQRP